MIFMFIKNVYLYSFNDLNSEYFAILEKKYSFHS